MIHGTERQRASKALSATRAPFAWDRDQIATSPAFQRLRHITQVMAPSQPGKFQNRLTHSREVARIGRALTLALLARPGGRDAADAAGRGGLDATVVEAAALAHDLGHPPFGHDAEDELDHLLTAAGVPDGFEANAQTLRIVCTLADGADGPGLNLTRATVSAILKYPWTRQASPDEPAKFGAYESEAVDLAWAKTGQPPGSNKPSLEAALVDWADLVAYAVHDFEDFARVGLIPLDHLTTDIAERERFLSLVCQRRGIAPPGQEALAATLERILASCPVPGLAPTTRAGRNSLRCFSNHQINGAISGVSLAGDGDVPQLQIEAATRSAILLLEGLTWHYVIDTEVLKPRRDQQRQVIREVFGTLANAALLPDRWHQFSLANRQRLRSAESEAECLRIVADVIASMTEEEATEAAYR